jgi:hypothetical protein
MIPKSDLYGAVSPAQRHGAPAVHPQLPAELSGAAKNFSVIVSQAIAKRPDQKIPSGSATVSVAFVGVPPIRITSGSNFSDNAPEALSSPENSDISELATLAAAEHPTETSNASKIKGRDSAVAPLNKSDFVDASILTSAMASLVQSGAAPPVFRKPASLQNRGEDLIANPKLDEKNAPFAGKLLPRSHPAASLGEIALSARRLEQTKLSERPHLDYSDSDAKLAVPGRGSATVSAAFAGIAEAAPSNVGKHPTERSNAPKSKGRDSAVAPLNESEFMDASVTTSAMASLVRSAAVTSDFRKPVSLQSQGEDLVVSPETDEKNAPFAGKILPRSHLEAAIEERDSTEDAPHNVVPPFEKVSTPGAEAADSGKPDLLPISANADASKTQPTPAEAPPSQSFRDMPGRHSISAQITADQPVAISAANLENVPAPNSSPPENGPPPIAQQVDIKSIPVETHNRTEASAPIDGTRAALPKQRMKFAEEKNDIAGRMAQKLPNAASGDGSTANSSDKDKTQAEPILPKHSRESLFPGSLTYFAANPNLIDALKGTSVEESQGVVTAAAHVERVAQLMSQEIFMVRQSGANALAVSLKVDANTELFLQLSNHNGQIQASLRCDRGNVAGLDSHWAELQQSLARQNVQLMPFENGTASVSATSITPATGAASSLPFDQSSQDRRPQFRDPLDETPMAPATVAGRVSGKTRTNNRSRQGWEKWA